MTNPCLLTWVLPLIGIRSAFAHHEIMETIALFRAIGDCYRLACSEAGSSLVNAQLTFNFFKTTVVGILPWQRRQTQQLLLANQIWRDRRIYLFYQRVVGHSSYRP
jgi:hypothetical protein